MKYYLSLLLIATGLSFTILFETMNMKIIGALLCVTGTALLIAYYQHVLRKHKEKHAISINEIKNQLKQEKANYETQFEEKQKEIEQLKRQSQRNAPPTLDQELSLEKRIQILREYFEKYGELDDNYRCFFAELKRAAIYKDQLKGINEHFTTPMWKKLEKEDYTLDKDNIRNLLGDLIQLALVAIDFTQEEHTEKLNGYDSYAINIAVGSMTPEEGAQKAKKASTNIHETTQAIRILNEFVQILGLSNRTLIVHDTLLQQEEKES